MPHRRTFAAGLQPFAHSDAACASPSWLRLASYAGSRGTGNPSLKHRPQNTRLDGEPSYAFTWITFAGGKPLKWVELAAE